MRLPRAIRLDQSDPQVFPKACPPGEWAIPGTFVFADLPAESVDNKLRLAFGSAWLGIESFGFTTLVEVAEIDEAGFFRLVEQLGRHLVTQYGAPGLPEALLAARAELEDTAGLCDHKLGSLLAIEREMTEAGITERVRVVQPQRAKDHARIWTITDDENGSG
ncbi:DUF6505 family protein [Pelagibius sp.]|uniref:DUF6505 family protein n=1 Tax=Pelagibius sp. TaxID=1931238 RepID=UPI003B50156F